MTTTVTTSSDFADRRRAVAARAAELGVESAALTSGWARPRNFAHNVHPFRAESHFLYLTGLHREGSVLVLEHGEWTLYALERDVDDALWHGYTESLEELEGQLALPVCPLAELPELGAAAAVPPQDDETATWLSDLLDQDVLAQSGPSLTGIDRAFTDALMQCRLVHDLPAIAQLRLATRGSAEAHLAGMAASPNAQREAQVLGALVGALLGRGLVPSYDPIVTTRAEVLHARGSSGSVDDGALILADVGGETPEGFTADITRTWPARGRFSSTQREVYDVVLAAQRRALALVAPGAEFRDLHFAALETLAAGLSALGILDCTPDVAIESGAASLFMPHGLGHLLGLDVHDLEDLGDRAGYGGRTRGSSPTDRYLRLDRMLVPGMCVTIEPGFYQVPLILERARADARLRQLVNWTTLARFSDVRGVRIEDDVLVTVTGAEVLSEHVPTDPARVEEAVLSAHGG